MRSSSPSATVTVSAEYDSPAHGSSFQVVSMAAGVQLDVVRQAGTLPGRPVCPGNLRYERQGPQDGHGTARITASPRTSPSSVSSRTCSRSYSTDRIALRSRTDVPRRPARCRATSWLPPATRQDGRRVNHDRCALRHLLVRGRRSATRLPLVVGHGHLGGPQAELVGHHPHTRSPPAPAPPGGIPAELDHLRSGARQPGCRPIPVQVLWCPQCGDHELNGGLHIPGQLEALRC
jgi:hypothetical protein